VLLLDALLLAVVLAVGVVFSLILILTG